MIIILGSFLVGMLQCIVPFIDKVPLLLMTPIEFLILKILLGFIPFIILIFIIFYSKKYHCKYYNQKIIFLTIISVLLSLIGFYIYTIMIKISSPGIIIPITISTIVVLTLFMDNIFFKRNISKRDIICIIILGICLFLLTSKKDYSEKSLQKWYTYLEK